MMNRISCDVVQDLLPLYYDDICSETSKGLVEEHLVDCPDCRSSLEQLKSSLSLPIQDMEVNKLEGKGLQSIKRMWSRTRSMAFMKGLFVAASVFGMLIVGYFGLFRWNILPVSSDHIIISDIRTISSGEIAFRVQIRDGYSFAHVKNTVKDDGSFYMIPVHPLIISKKYNASNPVNGEMFVNPLNVRAYQKKYGKDVEITSIYYGSPDHPILIWKKGMELPTASR
ncbi:zf-HC2 domain-containing protein [Paenibacillus sp. FSL F4-0243]|uniref:zf-HC2 domain-containing protein n=1 Tax=unclassified Paenibacillus TaxID=185978 RepID=UPI0030DDD373